MKNFGDEQETIETPFSTPDDNIDIALMLFVFMITYLITYDKDTKQLFNQWKKIHIKIHMILDGIVMFSAWILFNRNKENNLNKNYMLDLNLVLHL